MNYFARLSVCLFGVVAMLFVAAFQSAHARELEEVVVTAQKQEQSLQDVPIAVSALSQEKIHRTDTHDLATVAIQVPGLSFSPFSPGQNIVTLRGAASNDDGAGTDSSVAVFVDDVYLGRISNINPEMFDLERIEVLRGPQGTLYGKNTVGGALNVVSTRPDTEEFGGKFKINVGNYSRFDAGVVFTGPLGAGWAGKIALSNRERNGWVYNPSLDQDQKNDQARGFRAQLLYEGSNIEMLYSIDYNDLDVLDMGRVPLASDYNNNRGGANPAVFRAGFEDVCGNVDGSDCVAGLVDGYAEREAGGISAKITWHINDSFDFISITGYRESKSDWNMDSSGSPNLALIDDILDDTEQFSQEFRVLGQVSDFWDFVVGAWYLNERTDRSECFDLSLGSDCSVVVNGANDGSDYYRQDNETKSLALFGQFNLNFTEQWQLSLGGRFSEEEKSIDNIAIAGNFVIINQTFRNEREESWSAFTPKVSVRYTPWDHTSFYLSVAQGFKSGGFAAAPQEEAATEPLDQEEVVSVELGVKTEPVPNVRFSAALYSAEYEGLQIQSFGPRPGCVEDEDTEQVECFGGFRTFNAGDAEIQGLEAELTWLATDDLTLSAFVSIVDSEFGETEVPNSPFSNQEGQDLVRTPDLTWGLSVDYVYPLPNGSKLAFRFNHNFVDDQRGELAPYAIQYAYRLWDGRVEWTSTGGLVELALWGKNLANETYLSHLYTIAGSVTGVYGDPRMYGMSATFRY